MFTGFVACLEATRPRWFEIFEQFFVGAVSAVGQEKGWIRGFGIKTDQRAE